MDAKFEIDFGNGYVVVAQPRNAAAIRAELIWISQNPSASLQGVNFEWLGSTAKKINDYYQAGLIGYQGLQSGLNGTGGGYGIYEGLPIRITDCNTNLGVDLILDLVSEATTFSCDQVNCPIMERGRLDWFEQSAASFSFSYLASLECLATAPQGFSILTNADYKKTPYCISEIPDYTTVASLSVSLFILIYELTQKVEDVIRHGSKFIGDVQSLMTGGPVAIEEIARLAIDIIQILADLVIIIILVSQIVKLFNDLLDAIIQSKKYKYCMREVDLFTKACQYLGLSFASTIYQNGTYENATWMPTKKLQPDQSSGLQTLVSFKRSKNEQDTPFTSYGYFDGTFKEFIDAMKLKYNAEGWVQNGVYHFEPKHTTTQTGSYAPPNMDEPGYTFNLPDPHGTNASELPFNYTLQFQLDESESNTISFYKGTTCQYQISPVAVGNVKHLLKTGGVIVDIPCALGKRKNNLTDPEEILRKHETQINSIITIIPPSCVALAGIVGTFIAAIAVAEVISNQDFTFEPINISERFGWLLLSNDTFNIPKTFIGKQRGVEWVVSEESESIMSASTLMGLYHNKNLATHGAQRKVYKDKKIPFCCADFIKVLNNNKFNIHGNKVAEFTRIEWDQTTDTATCDYRIAENFTNNLTEKIIIDGN